MRKGGQRTMIKDNLVKRLIGSYPDAIETYDNGELDYESTVYNMSVRIMDTIDDGHQMSIFGKVFENEDDCYNHLIINVSELRETLEIYLHEDI